MFNEMCCKCHKPIAMRFYLMGKAVCAKCYFSAMHVRPQHKTPRVLA